MKYSMAPAAVAALLLVSLFGSAHAQTASQACDADTDSVYCLCRDARSRPPSAIFPDLAAAAVAVRAQFCGNLLTQSAVATLVDDFVADSRGWDAAFGGLSGDITGALLAASASENGPIGLTDVFVTDNDDVILRVLDQRFTANDMAACAAQDRSGGDETARCERVLQAFVDIYAYAQKTFAAFDEYPFARSARELSASWDAYFDTARGMTSLELLLNSAVHRRDETTQFSGPPTKQWVFLHPELVIENVRAAADGEELEEALAIEVVGLNFLDQRPWYVPSGGSLVVLYSDKATTDDVGIGAQLYFKSVYSLGYSNRGGDSGVFISVDLLKLFRDKRSELNTFLERP